MPQKSGKINEREMAVCSRVRLIREQIRWSQTDFANEISITRNRLVSVEYGRTPLRYDLALILCLTFDVSPLWLATGTGDQRPYVTLLWTAEERLGFRNNNLLTEVYDYRPKNFEWSFEKGPVDLTKTPDDFDLRSALVSSVASWCERTSFGDPRNACEFCVAVNEFISKTLARYLAKGLATRASRERNLLAFGRSWMPSRGLTNDFQLESIGAVKLPRNLSELRAWIDQRTKARGAKAALARELKVKLSDLSRWLSGRRMPDGETTLRLIEWVNSPKRK